MFLIAVFFLTLSTTAQASVQEAATLRTIWEVGRKLQDEYASSGVMSVLDKNTESALASIGKFNGDADWRVQSSYTRSKSIDDLDLFQKRPGEQSTIDAGVSVRTPNLLEVSFSAEGKDTRQSNQFDGFDPQWVKSSSRALELTVSYDVAKGGADSPDNISQMISRIDSQTRAEEFRARRLELLELAAGQIADIVTSYCLKSVLEDLVPPAEIAFKTAKARSDARIISQIDFLNYSAARTGLVRRVEAARSEYLGHLARASSNFVNQEKLEATLSAMDCSTPVAASKDSKFIFPVKRPDRKTDTHPRVKAAGLRRDARRLGLQLARRQQVPKVAPLVGVTWNPPLKHGPADSSLRAGVSFSWDIPVAADAAEVTATKIDLSAAELDLEVARQEVLAGIGAQERSATNCSTFVRLALADLSAKQGLLDASLKQMSTGLLDAEKFSQAQVAAIESVAGLWEANRECLACYLMGQVVW